MFAFLPHFLIGPVAVVTMDFPVILSVASAIPPFEEIQIVNSVPGHATHEPITTVQVPMPKFAVPLKPTRQEPGPAVLIMVTHNMRPVLDLVCRCIRCTDQKQAYAEAQRADRA